MRCNQQWCIPTASSLLLLCALCSTPPAAAQVTCTVSYNCHGSTQCAYVVGGPITRQFASASECNTQAAAVGDGPTTIGRAAVVQQGAYMLGQQLHNLLFDQPAQPAAPLDPAMQQQQLAAQQLNNSGNYLLKKNDYAGAINEFEQALAIEPNDQDILHNLKGQNRRNGMPSWPDKPTAR